MASFSSHSRYWCIVLTLSSIALVICVFGLILTAVVLGLNIMNGVNYAVVIDAGSSGSRPTLFKWQNSGFREDGRVEQINDTRVAPGIAASLNNPGNVFETVEPAVRGVLRDIVPESDWQNVKLYMISTAGARLININDPDLTSALFSRIRRDFLNSSFYVQRPEEHIRLSSGAEEGLNGWFSINYLQNAIGQDNNTPQGPLYGSLDLGGASTQIAFSVAQPSPNALGNVNIYRRSIRGQIYRIYSHSFLCYGLDEFLRRFQAELISVAAGLAAPIANPCMNMGNNVIVQTAGIYASPCITNALIATRAFGGVLLPPANLPVSVTFTGTGDAAQCRAEVEAIFQNVACQVNPCSVNGIHQPQPEGEFFAYSAFSFYINYLNISGMSAGLTRNQVTSAVNTLCSTPWANVVPQDGFTSVYCFNGVYADRLLQAYGFVSDDSWRNLRFVTRIDHQSIGWALGYMVDAAGRLPRDVPPVSMPLVALVIMIVVCIILIILLIVVIVLAARKYKTRVKQSDGAYTQE